MTTLEEAISPFSSPNFVPDFVLSLIFFVAISVLMCLIVKKLTVIITYAALNVVFLFSLIFSLDVLKLVILFAFTALTIMCAIVNTGALRKYIAKPLKGNKTTSKEKAGFDKDALITNVVTAVNWLSETKTGALITFEKNTPLDDFIRNGSKLDCTLTPEILETIFYEGTRLHDGAVIVRGDKIIAAAVYYPPTTKAVAGKVGARHRAAIGISEITDSITIVVSEETGRISVTHSGMIDNIKTQEFEKVFRNRII